MSQYTSRPQDNVGNDLDQPGPTFPGARQTGDPGLGQSSPQRSMSSGMGGTGTSIIGAPATATGSSTPPSQDGTPPGLLRDAAALRSRWESVQVGFVDDPRRAVGEAEDLVSSVIDELVSGFRQERDALEAQWSSDNAPSTDSLRMAFQRYRDFFDRLLQV